MCYCTWHISASRVIHKTILREVADNPFMSPRLSPSYQMAPAFSVTPPSATFGLWLTHRIYDWNESRREKKRFEGFADVNFSPGHTFLLFVASSTPVPVVGFACSFHYPGHVALLRLLAARLSSPLIGFRYIKPPWPRGHPANKTFHF